ncbi:hypothetical protein IV203_036412 [Nitzschia inconspicua]|uniref:DUF4145 domain-containing protein n=1 Tax=Nitzschia inconspicua TaxID=303405 RepID=A0A9K3LFS9_9STRA|nr:hypothetical protein IV203_036412 [Nitzschia inconspicua]
MGGTTSKYSHIANDFELAIRSSKDLEHILETEFGAQGKGLHEKISSIETSLPPDLVRNMRYLATIRNKLVHEHDFNKIPERQKFVAKFEQSTIQLKKAIEDRRRARGVNESSGGCIIC